LETNRGEETGVRGQDARFQVAGERRQERKIFGGQIFRSETID